MAEIKVTSGELKNNANELRQLNNQFKKAIDDLTSSEQQLVGMWDGEAKEAFHNAYNSDKAAMENFFQTIEKYCQALESNAAKYEAMEQKNLSTASTKSYK